MTEYTNSFTKDVIYEVTLKDTCNIKRYKITLIHTSV